MRPGGESAGEAVAAAGRRGFPLAEGGQVEDWTWEPARTGFGTFPK